MNERASVPSELGAVADYKPAETSADDEAFVVELATSLVVLIATWRERETLYRQRANSGQPETTQPMYSSTAAAFGECAAELEAVLRSAT